MSMVKVKCHVCLYEYEAPHIILDADCPNCGENNAICKVCEWLPFPDHCTDYCIHGEGFRAKVEYDVKES